MPHIIILGAGLTGLSTAYHLEQQGFHDYLVFEKEDTLGGLCGSIEQDGFTFDYTGHLLHINDPYMHSLIAKTVGFDHFNVVNRRAFIYSHDRYTAYPYQINLQTLPAQVIAECIKGYVQRHTHIKKPEHFIAWVLKYFGPGFAKHFFVPYQRKIFAYDLTQITASWTGRFVPSTSLEQIIDGIQGTRNESIGYNAQFFYPKHGGIVSWVATFAQHITNDIYYACKAVKIDLASKTVIFANGHVQPYKVLINTLPLDHFVSMLTGSSSKTYSTASSKLLCNSVLNINLGFARADVSDKHWIYFPEKKYPFYRLGFPHNFSQHVVPTGCSSLYAEVAYINKSAPWKKKMTSEVIAHSAALLGIHQQEIMLTKILDMSHAYVIYDHWREKYLPRLLHALEQEQIYCIGRYGAWKYSSMQEAILEGKQIAQRLLVQPATVWHAQPPYHHKELTV